MKKSKLIKSLVAFAISVAAVIGCISLVACGGGEDNAVNSVSLNKPTLSLQVDATETLVATTDPVGATVTWSSSDNTKVEVDQTGKVTAKAVTESAVIITAQAGEKKATCSVTVTAKGGSAVTLGGTFSWDALREELAGRVPDFVYDEVTNANSTDKVELVAEDFTGVNEFLTFTPAKSNVYRSNKNGSCIEIKDGALSVTFTGAGTITIGFGSTGSADTNVSGLALKKGETILEAASVSVSGTTPDVAHTPVKVADTDEYNAGYYQVTKGSNQKSYGTVTFNITEAGTYTIWGGNYGLKDGAVANARATRIYTIVMVDNGAQA